MFLPNIFSDASSSKINYMRGITVECSKLGSGDHWLAADISILISGLVANIGLLWLFFKERRTLSASQVLGVNLVVMDLIYLFTMPISITYDVELNQKTKRNISDTGNSMNNLMVAKDIFSMFSLIGCPLLLACMCVERYLAVIRPVLYMRLRRWEHRVAVSAVTWLFTLSFCLAAGLKQDPFTMMVPVSVIISCLFLLMLFCLGGVVRSLWQQSPALTTVGNQPHSVSPMKRRAVVNVLAVVVPAVTSYLPVLGLFPVVLYKYYWNNSMDNVMCAVFDLSKLFPKFGVLIGPLFYLSKARQIFCLCGTREKLSE